MPPHPRPSSRPASSGLDATSRRMPRCSTGIGASSSSAGRGPRCSDLDPAAVHTQVFEREQVLVVTRAVPGDSVVSCSVSDPRTASSTIELAVGRLGGAARLARRPARDRPSRRASDARAHARHPRELDLGARSGTVDVTRRPSPPTACSCTLTSASPTRSRSFPTSSISASTGCTSRPCSRRVREAATDTTSSTARPSTPSSEGAPASKPSPTRFTRPGSASSSTSCRTTRRPRRRNPHWYALLRDGPDAARWFDVDTGGQRAGRTGPRALAAPRCVGRRRARRRRAPRGRRPSTRNASPATTTKRSHSSARPTPTSRMRSQRQHYKLAPWRTGTPFLNYRRFFDVSELAGVRVEDPDVFAASHALIAELWDAGIVDGLRVDHIDGLADPATYLRRLGDLVPDAFVVTEKILAADEVLPPDWPVAGTTGYESTADLTAVLIDSDGRARLEARAARGTGPDRATTPWNARRRTSCSASCSRRSGDAFAARSTRPRPPPTSIWTPTSSPRALAEITLGLRVYRTYCTGEPAGPTDRARIADALTVARAHASEPRPRRGIAPSSSVTRFRARRRPTRLELVRLWQQLTGPVMAKGREDTACYRYPVLLAQGRGRQRSVRSRDRRRRPVPHERRAPRRLRPTRPHRDDDARHQTQRGPPRPPRRAERTLRGVRSGPRPLDRDARTVADHQRARAPVRGADTPRHLAPRPARARRPRAAPVGLPGEGTARSKGGVVVARARRGARSARRRARDPDDRRRRARAPRDLRRPRRRRRLVRRDQRPRAAHVEAGRAGRRRHLPRAASSGTSASSTPTTAGPSTTDCASRCSGTGATTGVRVPSRCR